MGVVLSILAVAGIGVALFLAGIAGMLGVLSFASWWLSRGDERLARPLAAGQGGEVHVAPAAVFRTARRKTPDSQLRRAA